MFVAAVTPLITPQHHTSSGTETMEGLFADSIPNAPLPLLDSHTAHRQQRSNAVKSDIIAHVRADGAGEVASTEGIPRSTVEGIVAQGIASHAPMLGARHQAVPAVSLGVAGINSCIGTDTGGVFTRESLVCRGCSADVAAKIDDLHHRRSDSDAKMHSGHRHAMPSAQAVPPHLPVLPHRLQASNNDPKLPQFQTAELERNVSHQRAPGGGAPTLLTEEEEHTLLDYLLLLRELYIDVTVDLILMVAVKLMPEALRNGDVTRHWVRGFMDRNGLSDHVVSSVLKAPGGSKLSKLVHSDAETVRVYWTDCAALRRQLHVPLHLVANVDEMSIPYETHPNKVVRVRYWVVSLHSCTSHCGGADV